MQIERTNTPTPTASPAATFFGKLFEIIFYLHLLLISALVIYLIVCFFLYSAEHNQPKWYPQIIISVLTAAITASACLTTTLFIPSKILRLTFWAAPLLTLLYAITILVVFAPWSPLAAVFPAIFSGAQALYYTKISTYRVHFTSSILELSVQKYPRGSTALTTTSIFIPGLYASFLLVGISTARSTPNRFNFLFIFLIIVSLAWTTHVIENLILSAVARMKYAEFRRVPDIQTKVALRDAFKKSMGSIVLGSIIVPFLVLVRLICLCVRVMLENGDHPFCCCTGWCARLGPGSLPHANRLGFVHVGLHGKNIVHASRDAWVNFCSDETRPLIEADVFGAFFFMCGVAGGAACAVASGIWTLLVDKVHTPEISAYAFFVGYFMSRVAMAWPQGSVLAYKVAYAETGEEERGEHFGASIPERLLMFQERERLRREREFRPSFLERWAMIWGEEEEIENDLHR